MEKAKKYEMEGVYSKKILDKDKFSA